LRRKTFTNDRPVSHQQSGFLCCVHVFNHLPNYRFSLMSWNVPQIRLCGRLQGQSVCSVQGGSDNLQVWMLILHRSSDILMAHGPHHRREVAGVA